MTRLVRSIATLLFAGSSFAYGELTSPEIEEAAELARRAATAVMRGSPKLFSESLHTDHILRETVGQEAWRGLTEGQRDQLRSAVRRRFLQALAPSAQTPGEIGWSTARPAPGGTVFVFLGLRYGKSTLKTRWEVFRSGESWRVADVTLSDPGLSLARQAALSLGSRPVVRRNPAMQARAQALPRLLGLAAIALIVLATYRRISPPKRKLLLITASAPTILFLVDGSLSVHRALSQTYSLEAPGTPEPWRREETLAVRAQREGKVEAAKEHWAKALAAGAPPAPVDYQIGLAERDRGDLRQARAAFERALGRLEPAPGAARELGLFALAEGKSGEAREHLRRYLQEAGPDPDALSTLAVAETNLGHTDAALEAIRGARELVGDEERGAELEAHVRAQARDAPGAVEALRVLESKGLLDRSSLRADPAYLPIALEPEWVSFLAETPTAPSRTPRPTS